MQYRIGIVVSGNSLSAVKMAVDEEGVLTQELNNSE